jgi:Zn-dependent metalloprotease
MTTLPHVCAFIPPHMLHHVARSSERDAAADARATLDQMHTVVEGRGRAFLPTVPPARSRGRQRYVYDARNKWSLPGWLIMSEHRTRTRDVEAREAFDGAGATYDFFQNVFGRRSIDGRNMPIHSTVHYGQRFANAMWNGEQIIYGDGDGYLFGRFTAAVDVVAHELTHGVTQNTAGLLYTGQSGALNEHISDAFGSMVRQFLADETAETADWLIGKGVLAPRVKGRAIRSMAAPGTAYDDPILGRDPQPSHMRKYVRGAGDNGGIHINSGIPNHAFYLAATMIGGRTWPVLGRVWYRTLTEQLKAEDGFQQFADKTTRVAGDLFGFGGTIQTCIAAGWSQVGLPVPSEALVPPLSSPPVAESIWAVHPSAVSLD